MEWPQKVETYLGAKLKDFDVQGPIFDPFPAARGQSMEHYFAGARALCVASRLEWRADRSGLR